MARVKPIQTEAWFRKLAEEGTIEIFLKAGDRKIRAHGPEAEMYELVAFFEEKTGLRINGDWRRPPRSGPRPIEGQLDITELESGDEPPEEEGPPCPGCGAPHGFPPAGPCEHHGTPEAGLPGGTSLEPLV